MKTNSLQKPKTETEDDVASALRLGLEEGEPLASASQNPDYDRQGETPIMWKEVYQDVDEMLRSFKYDSFGRHVDFTVPDPRCSVSSSVIRPKMRTVQGKDN